MSLNDFMKNLKRNKNRLTVQQFRTLKGQAVNGDIIGASKGLSKLLKRG